MKLRKSKNKKLIKSAMKFQPWDFSQIRGTDNERLLASSKGLVLI